MITALTEVADTVATEAPHPASGLLTNTPENIDRLGELVGQSRKMMQMGQALMAHPDYAEMGANLMARGLSNMSDIEEAKIRAEARNKEQYILQNGVVSQQPIKDGDTIIGYQAVVVDKNDPTRILDRLGSPIQAPEFKGYTQRAIENEKTIGDNERTRFKTKMNIFEHDQNVQTDVQNAAGKATQTELGKGRGEAVVKAKDKIPSIENALSDVNDALSLLDNGLSTGKIVGGQAGSMLRTAWGDSDFERFESTTRRLALANLKERLGSANLSNSDVIYNTAAEGIGGNVSVETNKARLLKIKSELEKARGNALTTVGSDGMSQPRGVQNTVKVNTGNYSVGTRLKLSNGKVGVVVAPGEIRYE